MLWELSFENERGRERPGRMYLPYNIIWRAITNEKKSQRLIEKKDDTIKKKEPWVEIKRKDPEKETIATIIFFFLCFLFRI